MITNEKEYQNRQAQAKKFEQALGEFAKYAKQHPEIDPRILRAREDSLITLLFRIRQELKDYEVQALALEAKKYPEGSSKRIIYLTRLSNEIQKSNQLHFENIENLPPDIAQDIFHQALDEVIGDIFREIDAYNPDKGTVLEWVKSLLKQRLFNAFRENINLQAEPEPDYHNWNELESDIQNDLTGKLKKIHLPNYPEINLQKLAEDRLMGKTWREISEQLPPKISQKDSQKEISEFYPNNVVSLWANKDAA